MKLRASCLFFFSSFSSVWLKCYLDIHLKSPPSHRIFSEYHRMVLRRNSTFNPIAIAAFPLEILNPNTNIINHQPSDQSLFCKNFTCEDQEVTLECFHIPKLCLTCQTPSPLLAAKTSPRMVLLTPVLPGALRYSCAFAASLSQLVPESPGSDGQTA